MSSILMELTPFIGVDSDGKLFVHDETAEALQQHGKPVVVIAIVGNARRGKSYLMNRMLGRQSGFPLGSTTNATTKGIWAWLTDHPTRSNEHLLLLDTEGLSHATDGDENRDIQIFVLSVILSSTLIYNCQGVIDESCLELLDLVSRLSEHLVL
ncbi:guanylate-binding protein 1 isoform X2 [Lingula anatina]|uniref:Guanylate-binding protein 1 isoform X2 n=1 Tax=Lingula anatina TaxID=7574 RepID=A0A1S3HU79_LINAN|nr:guanylate-binding protein 1 isoform X2 [Lingula anatina]|eukprot:XP_013389597.1 guanylate-binding protein 1 isoform X2 [Lingula anatina]